MWDGFNKRKFPRINVRCVIQISAEDHPSPIHTHTENIGLGGVCVVLASPLERFSKCRVHLDLSTKKKFSCDGKIVWVVPTNAGKDGKKRFDIGVEFSELNLDEQETLRHFLSDAVSRGAVTVP